MSSQLASKKSRLRADCEHCFGLCCVALPYAKSADFAMNKDGGTPCQNLTADFYCGIYQNLRQKGFRGCAVYECFGAGQKVSQVTYKGASWRGQAGGSILLLQKKCSMYSLLCSSSMKCFVM